MNIIQLPLINVKMKFNKVGMTGFEPATPRPPGVYATRLRHIPIIDCKLNCFPLNFKNKMKRF